ncbi:MAG: molybdopterin-dependent oxidoreductase, partial [Myxococcota bacterium]
MATTSYRTCNLCEAMCGVAIEHDEARVFDIRGDERDPFSQGRICPKAAALGDLHADPDRLRAPQLRRDGAFAPATWKRAIEHAAERIVDVQNRHGRHAVAMYFGNPTAHNLGAMLYGQLLLRSIGTFNRYSATSVDQLPHMLAALKMFGHQLLLPVLDIDRVQTLVIIGANPVVSNGSLMSAPGVKHRLKQIHARGGHITVVDPRRTETADLADEHLPIRPGTDAMLLAAMVHTVFAEELTRIGRLGRFTDGLDRLERWTQPFS